VTTTSCPNCSDRLGKCAAHGGVDCNCDAEDAGPMMHMAGCPKRETANGFFLLDTSPLERPGTPTSPTHITVDVRGVPVLEWRHRDRVLTVYVEKDGLRYLCTPEPNREPSIEELCRDAEWQAEGIIATAGAFEALLRWLRDAEIEEAEAFCAPFMNQIEGWKADLEAWARDPFGRIGRK